MKLEDQVCSLELAKRLKELGAKQESLFVWIDGNKPYVRDADMKGCLRCGAVVNGIMPPRTIPTYAAFTVAELGEIMPPERQSSRDENPRKWKMFIHSPITGSVSKVIAEDTEADARAKMLVYLIENKLITV